MVSPQQLLPYNGKDLIGYQFGFIMYIQCIYNICIIYDKQYGSRFKAIELSPPSQYRLHIKKKNPHKVQVGNVKNHKNLLHVLQR